MNRAFTLLELVVSLAIVSVLLLAIGSVLRLTAYVAAGSAYDASCGAQSADVSSQIMADLNVALNFTEATATAVTFTVPDRTGSGQPNTIRYFWTGSAAQTSPAVPAYCVARQIDGGAPVVIASDVRQFNLNYLYRTMAPAVAAAPVQMASADFTSGNSNDWAVSTTGNWACQVFTPSPPAGTTSWTLTNVRLYLHSNATADGVIRVQVRTATAGHLPTSTVLATASVAEAALNDTYGWVDVPFSLAGCSPTQPLAIVVSGSAGSGSVCQMNYVTAGAPAPPAGAYASQSTNGGASWTTPASAWAYRFYVFGTVP